MRDLKENFKYLLKKNKLFHPFIRHRSWLPNIGPNYERIINGSKYTLLMVVREGYNYKKPNANFMIRQGFCNGFLKMGINYKIVSVLNLREEIEATENPLIFLSFYDYFDFNSSVRKFLRKFKHFVWINPDNDKLEKIYAEYNYNYKQINSKIYKLVCDSEPNFIFTPSPESAFDTFRDWQETELRLVSIPLACDDTRYFPKENEEKYKGTELAFVGGYWKKKSFQFDSYLKPFESRLKVFGYTEWPYLGYSGLLPLGHEADLYQNAKVSPAISEPHAKYTGDIVERVFKVMGSGGLAITDVNPHYAALFEKEELLVPTSIEEYLEFVERALNDQEFNQLYRQRGVSAIIKKHTYQHRAEQILEHLNIL